MPDKPVRQRLEELEAENNSNKQHAFIAQYKFYYKSFSMKEQSDIKEIISKLEEEKKSGKSDSKPVSSEDMVEQLKKLLIKKGDHLRFRGRGKFYFHHVVCIKVDDKGVTVMEYTGPVWGVSASSQSVSASDIGRLGAVKESRQQYTFSELEKKKAEVVIWPEELRRFTPEEMVERAGRREKENYYSLLKNNCEHFVTWCICGLMVSLQVKSWHIVVKELLFSVLNTKTAACVAANVFDEVASIAHLAGGWVFWIGAAIEVGIAAYEIYKAYNQWQDGILIPTNRDFAVKIFEILAKGLLRFGLGYLGSKHYKEIVSKVPCLSYFKEVIQSLVCGAVGGAVGHLTGVSLTWIVENWEYIVNSE